MKVAHLDSSCLLCADRRDVLQLLRVTSLALGSSAATTDDTRFAMEFQSALLAALRQQLRSDLCAEAAQGPT